MDEKELLQIIGRVYVELHRASSLLQQFQKDIKKKDELILSLEERIRGLSTEK